MDAVMREKSYQVFSSLMQRDEKTPAAVAKDLGFSPTLFSDWKSNKSAPNVEKLVKLADYFNVSVTAFLSE